jgi:hypothetical protein
MTMATHLEQGAAFRAPGALQGQQSKAQDRHYNLSLHLYFPVGLPEASRAQY